MNVNVMQVIHGFDGAELKADPKPGQAREAAGPLTLREVITNALVCYLPDEKPNGKAAFDRYRMAKKIHDNDEVDLTIEEIAMIKNRVGSLYLPNVVGGAWSLLDPPVN